MGSRLSGRPDIRRKIEADSEAEFNIRYVKAANGQVVVTESKQNCSSSSSGTNGCLEVLADDIRTHDVVQYASYQDAVDRKNGHVHAMLRNATQVVAYEVGFAALTPDGNVWTWGDSRYPGCLGRNAHQT